MEMDLEKVRWISHLARLELGDADLIELARQLSAIVSYVDQLQTVNTDGVEPLAHPLDMSNVFREDEPGHSLSVNDALANAPSRNGDFFSVPAVLD